MGKQRKHSNSNASDFFDYSEGKTSGKDRNAFERQLQKDAFEAEAAEGLGMVSREEMEEDLHAAAGKIQRRTRRRRRIAWYSAAAAVASLMIVATIFFNIDNGSMERYRTAPEFEEAAQEQPSGPAMIKEETMQDVIPDDAEKGENILPGKSRVQKESGLPEDGVMEDDPMVAGDEQIGGDNDLKVDDDIKGDEKIREVPARQQTLHYEEVEQDQIMHKEVMRDELSRDKVMQDEIPDMEMVQPLQDQEDEIVQPLQGQARGVEIAQNLQGQVSGIVYSAEDLQPLPGVSLFIKGSTTGTVSDIHGNFTLNTAETAGSTLVAQSIGMQTEEIPLDARQPMEIAMIPDAVQLDEVVVVGYESSKERTTVSAVSRVEPDQATATEQITASPLDGVSAFRRYLDTTLVYPVDAASAEKEVVVLKFSISPNGRPRNFRAIRSPGEAFTREAIRVLTAGPDWNPASSDGVYVDDQVRLRIVFRPSQQ